MKKMVIHTSKNPFRVPMNVFMSNGKCCGFFP